MKETIELELIKKLCMKKLNTELLQQSRYNLKKNVSKIEKKKNKKI